MPIIINDMLHTNLRFLTPMLTALFLWVIISAGLLYAQSEEPDSTADTESAKEKANAEFLSKNIPRDIRVAVNGNDVRLDWYNVGSDSNIQYVIYKHDLPIDNITVRAADPVARLNPILGENRFYDTIYEPGYWYYAIALLVDGEHMINYFARRYNATETAIYISRSDIEKSETAMVRDIAVGTQEGIVGLTFVSNNLFRDLLVIRSNEPIVDHKSARRAERVDRIPGNSTNYADLSPTENVGWYYAIVDAHALEFSTAGVEIVLGENATRFPVEVSKPSGSIPRTPFSHRHRTTDTIPLPLINPAVIDEDFFEDVEILNSGIAPPIDSGSKIEILYPDTREPLTENERELHQVLNGSLKEGKWTESITLLQNILEKKITPDMRARARYYQGQAYFYHGEYQKALFEFVHSQSVYKKESTTWINRVLNYLSR